MLLGCLCNCMQHNSNQSLTVLILFIYRVFLCGRTLERRHVTRESRIKWWFSLPLSMWSRSQSRLIKQWCQLAIDHMTLSVLWPLKCECAFKCMTDKSLLYNQRESGTAVAEWDSQTNVFALSQPGFTSQFLLFMLQAWLPERGFTQVVHFGRCPISFNAKRGLKDETPIYLMASTRHSVCLPKPTSKVELFRCLVLRRLFDLFARETCGARAGERCCWYRRSVIIHFQQGLFQMRGFGRRITLA